MNRFGRSSVVSARFSALLLLALAFLLAGTICIPFAADGKAEGGNTYSDESSSGNGEDVGLGCLPASPEDARPIEYVSSQSEIKSSVDLSRWLPPVGNQGNQNSCTAWATGYYNKSWLEKRKRGALWDLTDQQYVFSPAFIYNQIKVPPDQGSYIYDALELLERQGCTDLVEMPYTDAECSTQPTTNQKQAALPYRTSGNLRIKEDMHADSGESIDSCHSASYSWGSLWVNGNEAYPFNNPIEDMKRLLSDENPVIINVPIYTDFPDYRGNPPNPYYVHNGSQQGGGGHAMLVVGYNDNINPGGASADLRGGFLTVNSWGANWNGNSKGFVYLSYDFIRRYSNDAWVMTDTRNDTPVISSIEPDSANPGDIVEIKGSNFGRYRRQTSVTLNGEPLTPVSYRNNLIKFEVPSYAKSGKVRVNNWYGIPSNEKDLYISNGKPSNSVWYSAEGSTKWGFNTTIGVLNPNHEEVTILVTYMTSDGPVSGGEFSMPARSMKYVRPKDALGETDFSTKIECREGKDIAVDRTMWWFPPTADVEAHCSIAATAPASTWYLPEGCSDYGFETWLLIQNPNNRDVNCTVTYMIEGRSPEERVKTVPANSRSTFNMSGDIGSADASMKVQADLPVLPERAMYWDNRRGGHASIGTTQPSLDYYLAEGTTAWGFNTWLLIQNPNNSETQINVTYMTDIGPVSMSPFSMDANSRRTILVNDVPGMYERDTSIHVSGSQPIIAERAMYWNNETGWAGHDSIGMPEPHTTFYHPSGETGDNDYETWTLVQNPNDQDIVVEISYLTSSGEGNHTFQDTIQAKTRKTYNMADYYYYDIAGTVVRSLTSGKKIMVERAMYYNNRGAGTNTIGGFSD